MLGRDGVWEGEGGKGRGSPTTLPPLGRPPVTTETFKLGSRDGPNVYSYKIPLISLTLNNIIHFTFPPSI